MYELTFEQRMRRSERRRAKYRGDPDYRLQAINRRRARDGYATVSSLEECKLRLPLPEDRA